MISVAEKLIQLKAEFETMNSALAQMQERMISSKGLKKKVLKKSCFDLDKQITTRRAFAESLKEKPEGAKVLGMDPEKWRKAQASKRLRGEI